MISYMIRTDFGTKYKDFGDFFDKLIEDTLSRKLIWEPIFSDKLMWNSVGYDYICKEPIIRCKIGKRYLYAELEDRIVDVRINEIKKTVVGIYSIINNKKKYYLDTHISMCSDYDDENEELYYEKPRFIYARDKALDELYEAIKKIYGDLFKLYKREIAINKINFLNDFYDRICSHDVECEIDRSNKTCEYKNYYLSSDNERIYISFKNRQKRYWFDVYKNEIDKIMNEAYGNITYYDYDKRFENLFDNWHTLWIRNFFS